MYAGQAAGLVQEVGPAGEIVHELAAGAESLIARFGAA
jgi:hypothetical protein